MQHDAADELDIEVPHAEHAPTRFANHGERIDQQVVELGALLAPLAKLRRPGAELVVGERTDGVLPLADGGDKWLNSLEIALVLRAEDLGQ